MWKVTYYYYWTTNETTLSSEANFCNIEYVLIKRNYKKKLLILKSKNKEDKKVNQKHKKIILVR